MCRSGRAARARAGGGAGPWEAARGRVRGGRAGGGGIGGAGPCGRVVAVGRAGRARPCGAGRAARGRPLALRGGGAGPGGAARAARGRWVAVPLARAGPAVALGRGRAGRAPCRSSAGRSRSCRWCWGGCPWRAGLGRAARAGGAARGRGGRAPGLARPLCRPGRGLAPLVGWSRVARVRSGSAGCGLSGRGRTAAVWVVIVSGRGAVRSDGRPGPGPDSDRGVSGGRSGSL